MKTELTKELRVGPCGPDELSDVEALLAAAGLPVEGVADLEELIVARADGEAGRPVVIGAVGLEVYGSVGLLRSLVVAPELRGNGLGLRLGRRLIGRAAELGLERLYLLTLEGPFFERLGFEACERARVPSDLAASFQFTAAHCDAATSMTLHLGGGEALQDLYPGNHCFGCGPENARGLRLKSLRAGDVCVARFVPSPEHNAGPPAWLNGGIVATLLDCHGIFTAMADAYEREGRAFAAAPLIWYVTGALAVRYERPTPIDREVRLIARAQAVEGRRTEVECKLFSGETVCATASVVAVRVEEGWKNPRNG